MKVEKSISEEGRFGQHVIWDRVLRQLMCCFRRLIEYIQLPDLDPPPNISVEAVNCTAIRVQWKVPKHPKYFIKAFKVFYFELTGHPKRPFLEKFLHVPVTEQTMIMEEVVGDLIPGSKYLVTVAAESLLGSGPQSTPQSVVTLLQDSCMTPEAPQKPQIMVVSDSEVALAWKPGEKKENASIQYYLVEFIRPDIDHSWTIIQDQISMESMVIKGLDQDTNYQFSVRAVNSYGSSSRSLPSDLARTFGNEESGSGNFMTSTGVGEDDERFDDDFEAGLFFNEVKPSLSILGENKKILMESQMVPKASPQRFYKLFIPPAESPHSAMGGPKPTAAALRRLDSINLEPQRSDIVCDPQCSTGSFCAEDFTSRTGRCQCYLGKGGKDCSEDITIQYPRFYGYSYLAFSSLKNSHKSFQITLQFKADFHNNGLLLYCGHNEQGKGDFMSLVLNEGTLNFRFNCGSGVTSLISETVVQIGVWHTVMISKNGRTGMLKLDNGTALISDAPGTYDRITFRTPLYVGGIPTAHWISPEIGSQESFQGCVQSLSINGKIIDLRPQPLGSALHGADVGECSQGTCDRIYCVNGGICTPSGADSYLCLCPLGFRGRHCEEEFTLIIPQFSESLRSFAAMPWPLEPKHYLSYMDFEITFRPESRNGVLLYSHDMSSRDFVSVTMAGGHVEFRFNCGSGTAILRSEEPLTLNQWHELHVSRTARKGTLEVDKQKKVERLAVGGFTQIKCSSDIFIGGVPNYDEVKNNSGVFKPFTGGIQKLILNDRAINLQSDLTEVVNLDNAAHSCILNPCYNLASCQPRKERYDCDCPLGFVGRHCQKENSITFVNHKMTEAPELEKEAGEECGNYCLNSKYSKSCEKQRECSGWQPGRALASLSGQVPVCQAQAEGNLAITKLIEIPQFIGRSYLTYNNPDILKR
ncbi:pikachurin-like [Suncus etruscus]|uniref:pikachurin-like n=1 Tax=Suncus etruscus TaxID=109475 RepID=UPI0021105729|nr:pikachurin-like [Suncus etruscus]